MCRKLMTLPITTPCAHNFCKACLEGAFAGKTLVRERNCQGRRTLRAQKNVMKCPHSSCTNDIAEFLQNPQVNRELMSVIESLKQKDAESEEDSETSSNDGDDMQEEPDVSDEEENSAEDGVQEEAEENSNAEADTNGNSKEEKANSGSPKPYVKTSTELHDGAKEKKTGNPVKPRHGRPKSTDKALLEQHCANDENPNNAVKPQENAKVSKVERTRKQKNSEGGGKLPSVNVGATTRSKRAKLAVA
ncbi:hypothetical protein TIFTF001_018572 [Ficus carica]|uniref:Zinc finger RING-type eukaryotic domain-containing protein n=1 Tax=Ficus carica TaxID=3494 RepID=A0AA88ANG9_FICCA|nr:hypothetical protein TIFTF001_018572 [Ficus carica]